MHIFLLSYQTSSQGGLYNESNKNYKWLQTHATFKWNGLQKQSYGFD